MSQIHLSSVCTAVLSYIPVTPTLRKRYERLLISIQGSTGKVTLVVPRITQVKEGIPTSNLRQLPEVTDMQPCTQTLRRLGGPWCT
ncbi:hypothetical protein DICVIV_10046 [Dictyocaulus viviparus]|uniref:Uncharacterized protein n=1 Tax=Dictyocaulus viviparus TaxID=29172 RepID=A0A0D8XH59_DICVI|nr:hypothetical protein DICVIV_10046 [Dictyocaulus viviparus]